MRGGVAVGPGDASGVEEEAEPVVVESSESVAGSFQLFDDQVEPFGGSVRCAGVVMVEDLCSPPGEGLFSPAGRNRPDPDYRPCHGHEPPLGFHTVHRLRTLSWTPL